MTVRNPCGAWPGTLRQPLDERLVDVVRSDLDEMTSLHENSMPLKRPCTQEPSVLHKIEKIIHNIKADMEM